MLEITLVGYGNQGKAWAANLRDSGWKVRVSGRPKEAGGQSLYAAAREGFEVVAPEKLKDLGGQIALLLPDETIPSFFKDYLAGSSKPRSFYFAHGFSVVFGQIPFGEQDDVILMAPKGIGPKMRQNYTQGSGVMGVIGVGQNPSGKGLEKARNIARGLGCTRVGLIESNFREETFADLLSEQAILCGAVPALVDQSVRFLVAKGIDPKLATYECLHELKLIVDMMVENGIHGMFKKVSRTAHLGGIFAEQEIVPAAKLTPILEKLWQEIESGSFAKALEAEKNAGYPKLAKHYADLETSPVDKNL